MMQYRRKGLIRNLVIAMVVADMFGIYYVHDRMTQPPTSPGAMIDDETIAAAATVDFKPQAAEPDPAPAMASRELPKPTFGQDEAKPADAPKAAPALAVAPKAKAAPALAAAVPTTPKPAAKALVAPKLAAAPAPKPRTSPALAVAPVKKAVTLSVIASASPAKARLAASPSTRLAKAEAPSRKRASFKKAFSAIAKAAPADTLVTSANGSLSTSPATVMVTAQFTAETPEPMPAAMGITSQAMSISQAGTAPDTALPKDLGGSPAPSTAASELPPVEEK